MKISLFEDKIAFRFKEDIVNGVTKLLYVAPESLTKEENVEEKIESSFLTNVAIITFIAVLIVCLYHIYLVYHYQKVINSGKLEYNIEWFFFPIFIILFAGIPLYLYIDEL